MGDPDQKPLIGAARSVNGQASKAISRRRALMLLGSALSMVMLAATLVFTAIAVRLINVRRLLPQ